MKFWNCWITFSTDSFLPLVCSSEVEKYSPFFNFLSVCLCVCLCVRRAPGRNFRHRDLKFGISTRLGTSKKRFFGFFENVIFGGLGGLFGVKKVKIHHFSAKITKSPFHFCFLWSLCRVRMFLWIFHIFPHIMGGVVGFDILKKRRATKNFHICFLRSIRSV